MKKTLNIPEEIPAELTSTTVELEIIGITDVKLDHCCVKCNRIVPTRSITKCENPKCKSLKKIQKKNWYVKAFVKLGNSSNMYLIFRNDSVKKILSMASIFEKIDHNNLKEEKITELFLSAPKLHVTYDSKSAVQNVEEFW